MCVHHRYLTWVYFPCKASSTVYLSCYVDSDLIYIMVVKVFVPLHRSFYFTGGLRCRPILMEHSLYISERTQKLVDNIRWLWCTLLQHSYLNLI
jgi:hypothetical protein